MDHNTGSFSGNGSMNIATDAEARLHGILATDSNLTMSGGGILNLAMKGDATLGLDGTFRIGGGGSSKLGITVENSGSGVLDREIEGENNALPGATSDPNGIWRNLNGGSLELAAGSSFRRLGNGEQKIINDVGGTITKTGSGSSTGIGWDIVNNGLIDVQEGTLSVAANLQGIGTIEIQGNAQLTFSGNVFQTHTLDIDPNGQFDFNGSRLEVVDFVGDFIHDQGVFAPGASPAVSSLDGSYTMTGSSIFEVELGGVGLEEFDQLFVSGDVNLTLGSLAISLFNGFVLSEGLTFDFLIIDGLLNGTFLGLDEGGLVGNFGQDLFITYQGGDGNDISLYTSGMSTPGGASVPTPGIIWLICSGLIVITIHNKRKSISQ